MILRMKFANLLLLPLRLLRILLLSTRLVRLQMATEAIAARALGRSSSLEKKESLSLTTELPLLLLLRLLHCRELRTQHLLLRPLQLRRQPQLAMALVMLILLNKTAPSPTRIHAPPHLEVRSMAIHVVRTKKIKLLTKKLNP